MSFRKAWVFLCLFGAVSAVFAAKSDQSLAAPFKNNAITSLRQVKPVVKGNSICYGQRVVTVNQDGSIVCRQPDGEVFSQTYYWVETKNKKYVGSFSTQSKKNNRFIMEPVKFANNTFTQKGKYSWKGVTGEFIQTVKILPDGRLEVANQLSLPAELRARVVEDGFFFNMPAVDTYGKKLTLIGPKKGAKRVITIPDKDNFTVIGNWRDVPSQLVFGKDTGKQVIFTTNSSTRGWSIRNYGKRTAFRAMATPIKNPKRRSSMIINVTAIPTWRKDSRPDFKKLENLRLYDDEITRNLLPDPSFEQGPGGHARIVFPGFHFHKRKWESNSFSVDEKVGYDGNCSLRINTFCDSRRGDWRGIWEAGDVTLLPVILAPGDYVFSCYIKGNRKGQELGIWPGRTSLPIEKELPRKQMGDRWLYLVRKIVKVPSEWTRVEIPMKVVINQPMCISFNAVSPTKDGSVWIDCIQLERGKKATAWQKRPVESRLYTEKHDNFLEYGKKHDISLTVSSTVTGKAETRVVDFFDRVIWSKKYDLKPGKMKIKINCKPDRGVFVVKTDYTLNNGKKTWDAHRFSVMDFLDNTFRHKNLFGWDYIHTFFMRHDAYAMVSRAQKLGYGSKLWVHCFSKDVYDLLKKHNIEFSHATVMKRHRDAKKGMRFVVFDKSPYNGRPDRSLKMILGDWRDEYGENADVPEDYLKRLKAAVKIRVKNYPWIRRWSFAGEDDAAYPTFAGLMAPEKNFRNYVRLQIAALRAVKEVDPTLEVIGGQIPCNTHPTGVPAVERFIKTAHEIDPSFKFDCFSLHTYRNRPENPDLDLDVGHLRNFMKKYGYGDDVKLLFTEGGQYNLYHVPEWRLEIAMWNAIHAWLYGAASYEMGWTEKMVAGIYARHFLTLLKYPGSSFACIAASAGMVFDMDLILTPFAPQKVTNTMARLLGDAEFVKDIRLAPSVRCYVFQDGKKRPVAAIWTPDKGIEDGNLDPMVAVAPFGKEQLEIFDVMEAKRKPVYSKEGKLRIGVSAQPMFLRGKPGRTAAFVKALSAAKVIEGGDIMPVGIDMKITPKAVKLHVKNPADSVCKTSIEYNEKAIALNIKGNAEKVLDMPLARPLSDKVMTSHQAKLAIGKFRLDRSFDAVLCRKVGARPDWKKLPVINFSNHKKTGKSRDFSGNWQMAWNDQYFFLRVTVRDNKFLHEEYAISNRRWSNDSLQIYFDTLCNARTKNHKGYDLDDYEYAVFPGKDGKSARLWRNLQPDIQLTLGTATPPTFTFADDVKTTFTMVPGGYVYEVAFPGKYLLPIQLKKGFFFGFGMLVNDRDDKNVKNYLTLAVDGKGCYNRPEKWPVVLLTE